MTRSRNAYRRADWWSANRPARLVDTTPAAEPAPVSPPADRPPFGYSVTDLDRIARSVAATTRAMAGDMTDRYQEALSAAAIHLYSAEQWMPEHELWRAAQDALFEQSRKDRSYQGCASRNGQWMEAGTGPRFVTYWTGVTAATPSPEDRVVERLALEQILPALTDRQRQVVDVLAACDDHAAAREALGGLSCYATHLANARRRFLALWHEGEVPSRPWGTDRRSRGGGRRTVRVVRRRARAAA